MFGKILRRVWDFLVRMDVASILITVVLVLALLGSFFPQRLWDIEADPEKLTQWQAGLRARYGGLASSLSAAGVFHYYQSPIFVFFVTLLGLITLFCTLNRWKTTWAMAFRQEALHPDEAFSAAPLKGRVHIATSDHLADILIKGLKRRGFRIRLEQTEDYFFLRAERNRLVALGTLVTHLGVVLLLSGVILSSYSGWRETVTVSPDHPGVIRNADNVEVQVESFDIERYPDGHPAGYEARITLRRNGQVLSGGSVSLNQPLAYGAINLYLQGFEQGTAGSSVSLLAVRDPGYGLVVTAGFLLLVGLAVTFNFPHCCVRGWLDRQGVLWLAGSADRRAYPFAEEFADWVNELRQDFLSQGAARSAV